MSYCPTQWFHKASSCRRANRNVSSPSFHDVAYSFNAALDVHIAVEDVAQNLVVHCHSGIRVRDTVVRPRLLLTVEGQTSSLQRPGRCGCGCRCCCCCCCCCGGCGCLAGAARCAECFHCIVLSFFLFFLFFPISPPLLFGKAPGLFDPVVVASLFGCPSGCSPDSSTPSRRPHVWSAVHTDPPCVFPP